MEDTGRPLLFDSTEALEKKIDEYFDSCEEEVWAKTRNEDGDVEWQPELDHKGNIRKERVKPYTVSGLAAYLGCDRRTLINYELRPEFFPIIKRAKTRIEAYVEETAIMAKNPTGSIFNLKVNFGWQEKEKVDLTIANKEGETLQITNLSQLSAEELRKLAQQKPVE